MNLTLFLSMSPSLPPSLPPSTATDCPPGSVFKVQAIRGACHYSTVLQGRQIVVNLQLATMPGLNIARRDLG